MSWWGLLSPFHLPRSFPPYFSRDSHKNDIASWEFGSSSSNIMATSFFFLCAIIKKKCKLCSLKWKSLLYWKCRMNESIEMNSTSQKCIVSCRFIKKIEKKNAIIERFFDYLRNNNEGELLCTDSLVFPYWCSLYFSVLH